MQNTRKELHGSICHTEAPWLESLIHLGCRPGVTVLVPVPGDERVVTMHITAAVSSSFAPMKYDSCSWLSALSSSSRIWIYLTTISLLKSVFSMNTVANWSWCWRNRAWPNLRQYASVPGGNEENLSQRRRFSGRDANQNTPDCDDRVREQCVAEVPYRGEEFLVPSDREAERSLTLPGIEPWSSASGQQLHDMTVYLYGQSVLDRLAAPLEPHGIPFCSCFVRPHFRWAATSHVWKTFLYRNVYFEFCRMKRRKERLNMAIKSCCSRYSGGYADNYELESLLK
jgi:hypothetical protein